MFALLAVRQISGESFFHGQKFITLKPGQKSGSYIGSCIFGTNNTNIEVNSTIKYWVDSDNSDKQIVKTEVKTVRNPLGIFDYSARKFNSTDYIEFRNDFTIKCVSDTPCKVQIIGVDDSVYSEYFENAGKYDGRIRKGSASVISFFSTKKENNLNLDLIDKHHFKDATNTSESIEYKSQRVHVVGRKPLKITIDKEATTRMDGEIDNNKIYQDDDTHYEFNTKFFQCRFDVDAGTNNEIKSNVKISWKEVATTSDDEEDWLIPEFEAILPARGGFFTLDNINQEFPPKDDKQESGNPKGMSGGAIAGIVIGVIVVVACIVVVCLWFFVFRKRNSEEKNEPDP